MVVTNLIICLVVYLQAPFTAVLVPLRMGYEMAKLHKVLHLVLPGNSLDIIVDFLSTSIVTRPVWIILKEKSKAWSRYVASNTRVSILKPNAPDIWNRLGKEP